MIIKTNEFGVTDIYPFIDMPEQMAFSARVTVYEGTVKYNHSVWTPEAFAQFNTAMQKAFELAGQQNGATK